MSKREPPVTRLAQNGWGVGEVGDALGKGGRTLPAHLACLRGAQSGWGRSDHCPSAPWACARLGGDAGVRRRKVQKGGASRGGDATCGPSDTPSGKRPPFAHKWGWGSKGWCGALRSESSGARVKGRDGVPFAHRSGSLACAPRWGGANPTHGGWGNACPRIKQEAYQAYPSLLCRSCCARSFARKRSRDRGGTPLHSALPSIQPSCPPPSYPKHPCSRMHSTHGKWGRGRGNHRANGSGLCADTVSAPPPRRASLFTCKGIGGANGTRGREECPLSPRSVHDTERGDTRMGR